MQGRLQSANTPNTAQSKWVSPGGVGIVWWIWEWRCTGPGFGFGGGRNILT